MNDFEYIKIEEDMEAPVTRRDFETLMEQLQSLYSQDRDPENIIQISGD